MKNRSSKINKRIRSGDKVIVLQGADKGRTGEVLSRTDTHVIVQGINVRKKHSKPKAQGEKGGIIELEMPLQASNVAVVNAQGNKVKLSVDRSGEKPVVVGRNKKDGKETIRNL